MTDKKSAQTLSSPRPVPSQLSIEERLKVARTNFEKAFKEFHELLRNKVLKDNKSIAAKKQEKYVVDQVVKACVNLDNLNVGEGVMALSVVALREHLQIRDKCNSLEYELELAKREIRNLKKELGIEK